MADTSRHQPGKPDQQKKLRKIFNNLSSARRGLAVAASIRDLITFYPTGQLVFIFHETAPTLPRINSITGISDWIGQGYCRKTAKNLDTLITEPTEEVLEIIEAADQGNWCSFTTKMGGAVCKRLLRPLQLAYRIKEKLGQYGDLLKKLIGLWSYDQAHPVAYPKPEWTIRRKGASTSSIRECLEAQAPPARTLEFCQ